MPLKRCFQDLPPAECTSRHLTRLSNASLTLQIYAGDTAELLHNMTRDVLQTGSASDLQLCGAYLQSGGGGSSNGSAATRRGLGDWPGPTGA